jgi:hypothetical protein
MDIIFRTKKPVEVVYQTAVFNMKNEKLTKPTKTKESKGPRLINDLICVSKMRRPSDSKRIIKSTVCFFFFFSLICTFIYEKLL